MPPKRNAPLGAMDVNVPPSKKTASKGKKAAAESTAAKTSKAYKYTDPSTLVNQTPVELGWVHWPKGDDEETEDEDEADQEDPSKPEPGSLQDVLNGIENERKKAVQDALDAWTEKKRCISCEKIQSIRENTSPPFEKRANEARQQFIDAKTMTEAEAKDTKGLSDEDRRDNWQAKQRLQNKLNQPQKDRNQAVHEALNAKGTVSLSMGAGRKRIAEAEKPFLKEMDEIRAYWSKYCLTKREVDSIVIPDDLSDWENQQAKKKEAVEAKAAKKAAEAAAFVPPRVVTDQGFPVSKAGLMKYRDIQDEVLKRDPDMHNMYICNDYAGHGITEVMENLLAEFNKLIFKKDESPLVKWTIVEGLATYLYLCDHTTWMMNDDSETLEEVLNMLGVMFITALEMLHESNLIRPESPLPDNIGIMTLVFLDFMKDTCHDFDLAWLHEVVRAADKYGVVLTPRKEIGFGEEAIEDMREECKGSRMMKGLAWKTEYSKFKRNHAGGHNFDITRMSKVEKAQYEYGKRTFDG